MRTFNTRTYGEIPVIGHVGRSDEDYADGVEDPLDIHEALRALLDDWPIHKRIDAS